MRSSEDIWGQLENVVDGLDVFVAQLIASETVIENVLSKCILNYLEKNSRHASTSSQWCLRHMLNILYTAYVTHKSLVLL